MNYVDAAVERLRLAEEKEAGTRNQPVVIPLHPLEKHHLHTPGTILDHDTQMLDVHQVTAYHRTLHLNIGQVRRHGHYGRNAAAVYISERIEMDEVLQGVNVQLLLKESSPLGPHAGKKLNITA